MTDSRPGSEAPRLLAALCPVLWLLWSLPPTRLEVGARVVPPRGPVEAGDGFNAL
jgi:hypothetical protein